MQVFQGFQRDPHRRTTRPASKDRDAVEDSTRARHSWRPGKAWSSSLGLARTTLPHPKWATQRGHHPGREKELTLGYSDRHLGVRGSTEGNGRCTPFSRGHSPLQRQPHRLRSAWGVRNSSWGSPHCDPQITSDSTGNSTAPDAGTNLPGWTLDRGRGRGIYYAIPRWSYPHKKLEVCYLTRARGSRNTGGVRVNV